MSKKFKILALSGGGARGVFQAQFLKKLNQYMEQTYHKKLWDFFDLFAGTSTGAIVAAALAMEMEPEKIVELYNKNMGTIFYKRPFARIRKGGKYSGDVLKEKIKEVLGSHTIGNVRNGLLITATSLDNYEGTYFTNLGDHASRDIIVVDAVLASTAAPSYFPAHQPEFQTRTFIDGGMWANAPALAAISFANRELGYAFEDIQMLCVGTGKTLSEETLEAYNSRPMLHPATISTVLDVLFNAQEQFSEAMSRQILDKPSLLVINPALGEKLPMDNYERAKAVLLPKADAEFDCHQQELKAFLERGWQEEKIGVKPTELALRGMRKAGLTSLIPTRDDYKKFREGGGNIESYIQTAEKSLTMVSITLETGVRFENLSRRIKELLRKGAVVTVSLLNPKNTSLMAATAPLFHSMEAGNLSGRIEESLRDLVKLKSDLSTEDKARFSIRVHDALPFGSAIMIDCETDGQIPGRIQIETKPYQQPYNSSFAFEITDYEGNELYQNIYKGYIKLMEDGHEWPMPPEQE